MLLKAQWISENNGGRNVVLATGTPITNTMAEVWTMMNFVAPDILDAYNINSFDEFATTFGTVEPSLEFTATGNFKIAERFKSYTNVPELIKAFRSHTDVVLTEDVKEFKEDKNIPKLKDNKMTNVIVEKNEDLEDVMQTLIKELEDYNKLTGKEKKDKSALPLVVFSKAKQAAIDLRLLNPTIQLLLLYPSLYMAGISMPAFHSIPIASCFVICRSISGNSGFVSGYCCFRRIARFISLGSKSNPHT